MIRPIQGDSAAWPRSELKKSYHGRCRSIASPVAGILMATGTFFPRDVFFLTAACFIAFSSGAIGQLKNGGKIFSRQDEAHGCAVDIVVEE